MHLYGGRCDSDVDEVVCDDAGREDHQRIRGGAFELGRAHVSERDLAGGSCESVDGWW